MTGILKYINSKVILGFLLKIISAAAGVLNQSVSNDPACGLKPAPVCRKIAFIMVFLIIINPFYNSPAFSKSYDAIYYYNTAVDFQNGKKYDMAIKNYKKALMLNPKLLAVRKNMLYAYISSANDNYNKGHYQQAIQNFKNALSINPRMAEIYYNLGLAYYHTGQNELAVKSYRIALKINPNFSEVRNNLGAIYFNTAINYYNQGLYEDAVRYYRKQLEYTPDDAKTYFNLGMTYNRLSKNNEAILCYKQALKIDPSFASAANNLEVSQKNEEEAELSAKINNLIPTLKAPVNIQYLVKVDNGASYDALNKFYEILDLIWSDPEGHNLLSVILDKNIPIVITSGGSNTNAQIRVTNLNKVITYAGIPVYTYKAGENKSITVNIGENHILAFKNPAESVHTRIYSLHTVIHELCHATKNVASKNSDNAMSEEIAASMIGYNIASRIIKGRDLTEKEVSLYAKGCMQAVLKDDHRLLPVYDNFIFEIQKIGVYPPYPYLYQNVAQLYKSVRYDPETRRVDSLEKMVTN